MNGFSLLIAVAALGVDVGWEAGPGGQSYYTVHIEKLLLEPLREGQAIVSNVDSNDRNLTRFQILIGDHAHAVSGQPGPSGSDMVQHGWRPGENGGTDYLIQISPERLESLAKGSSIIGQIDPKVTDIRKLYVFSGVQQLPQQLGTSSGPPPPPKFLGAGGGMRPASGETTQPNNATTGVGSPQFNGAKAGGGQYNGGPPPATGRANDFPGVSGSGLGGPAKSGATNYQANSATRGATQYSPNSPTNQRAQDTWRTSGQASAAWPNNGSQANHAGRYGADERMLPVPQLPTNQQQLAQNGYGQQPAPTAQQTYAPPLQRPGFQQPTQPYGAASPAYHAPAAPAPSQNVESQIAEAKAMWELQAKVAAAEERATAAADAAKNTSATSVASEAKDAKEPWMPLIITTLMLFTSLAINVFLGWLAWSFFWRFRDAAGDATRAQSTLFPTRQAA